MWASGVVPVVRPDDRHRVPGRPPRRQRLGERPRHDPVAALVDVAEHSDQRLELARRGGVRGGGERLALKRRLRRVELGHELGLRRADSVVEGGQLGLVEDAALRQELFDHRRERRRSPGWQQGPSPRRTGPPSRAGRGRARRPAPRGAVRHSRPRRSATATPAASPARPGRRGCRPAASAPCRAARCPAQTTHAQRSRATGCPPSLRSPASRATARQRRGTPRALRHQEEPLAETPPPPPPPTCARRTS